METNYLYSLQDSFIETFKCETVIVGPRFVHRYYVGFVLFFYIGPNLYSLTELPSLCLDVQILYLMRL